MLYLLLALVYASSCDCGYGLSFRPAPRRLGGGSRLGSSLNCEVVQSGVLNVRRLMSRHFVFVHCIVYTVHCIVYSVYCILHTVYCILHTVYCILVLT